MKRTYAYECYTHNASITSAQEKHPICQGIGGRVVLLSQP